MSEQRFEWDAFEFAGQEYAVIATLEVGRESVDHNPATEQDVYCDQASEVVELEVRLWADDMGEATLKIEREDLPDGFEQSVLDLANVELLGR